MKYACFPAIPNATAESLIGPHRWRGITVALQNQHGADVQIRVGKSVDRSSPDVWINGRKFGDLIELEDWAKGKFAR